MGTERVFGGKYYKRDIVDFKTKKEADKEAKRLQVARGYLVRVVKETRYSIWIH